MNYVALLLLLAARSAHAQPADHYGAIDLIFGAAAPVAGFHEMIGIEVGYRMAGWLGHFELAYGPAEDDQGAGYNGQLRAGIERSSCMSHPSACSGVGIDVGGQRGKWSDAGRYDSIGEYETVTALVAIPRAFVEVGGDSLRLRLGVEIDIGLLAWAHAHHVTEDRSGLAAGPVGMDLVVGVGSQW